MKLSDVVYMLHSRLLELRSLHRLLQSEEFEKTYENALDKNKEEVQSYIKNLDKEGVIKWLKANRQLEEYPMDDLRHLARCYGVGGYRFMSRLALISTIKGIQDNASRSLQRNESINT